MEKLKLRGGIFIGARVFELTEDKARIKAKAKLKTSIHQRSDDTVTQSRFTFIQ